MTNFTDEQIAIIDNFRSGASGAVNAVAGSGKTTTTGKLARWLSQTGHRPIVTSTDVYRPAAMEQLQAFLAAQPDIGKTQSLADLIKRMNRAMHGDDAAYDRLPDDQALIAQYLLLYSLSGGPEDFSSYVDNDYRRGIVWAFVRTDSTAARAIVGPGGGSPASSAIVHSPSAARNCS